MSAPALHTGAIPELAFTVRGAEPVRPAAVPTLAFALRIDRRGGGEVRAILLDIQLQIAAPRRRYGGSERERLFELFGPPHGWGAALRTLPWTRTTIVVRPFADETVVDVPVVCTYDLEVAASRYFDALEDGEVPIEFLFSGSVFYSGPGGGFQTARLSWEHEASYRLPVSVWRETMDRHFPGSAWLRLQRESYERLRDFRARHGLASWEQAVDALLEGRE